mmetsp:Transcript_29015/g.56741  ORF Transcript_29015/g.56741 Transcript_29015/m.56741 type:complete len:142 (+) Transcript_29015:223-648(+)|eukprot:CAMPEP_0173390394 /NCGR_PEP_ID=MMETSP1356-20130122/14720_1 /TAXON_ID=77927 ORGANISM="Hemiselmis virescens, Strain PCC157" /NCGR_SAMPLE_ID=MMETSP1356 /ASSEMBLY_ACC=CAM_ASM_000847 /LENGTH=141 /DNA_ID=CAMNT_0014347767 /DNA_START=223 /DNA_END=648 /DNA_ORIENTATION=+
MSLAWLFPRKQPPAMVTRIEPKQFYASERTYLTWMNMSVTIGTIGTSMVAITMADEKRWSSGVPYLASAFTLISIIFIIYALNIHFWRRRQIRRKKEGNYDDPYGPMALAITLVLVYSTVFSLGISKLSANKSLSTMLIGS